MSRVTLARTTNNSRTLVEALNNRSAVALHGSVEGLQDAVGVTVARRLIWRSLRDMECPGRAAIDERSRPWANSPSRGLQPLSHKIWNMKLPPTRYAARAASVRWPLWSNSSAPDRSLSHGLQPCPENMKVPATRDAARHGVELPAAMDDRPGTQPRSDHGLQPCPRLGGLQPPSI